MDRKSENLCKLIPSPRKTELEQVQSCINNEIMDRSIVLFEPTPEQKENEVWFKWSHHVTVGLKPHRFVYWIPYYEYQ